MNTFNEKYNEFVKICQDGELSEKKLAHLMNLFNEFPTPDFEKKLVFEMLKNVFQELEIAYDGNDLKEYQKLLNAIITFNIHYENIINGKFEISEKKTVAKDVFNSLNNVLENLNHYYQKLFQTTKELTKEKLPALKDFDDTLTKEEYVSYIRDLMPPTHNTLENPSKEDDLFKEMSFAEAISSYAINKEEVKEEEKEIVKEEPESISNNLLEEPPKVMALETKEERINREIKDERQANFEAYILKLYEGIDENRKRIGKLKYKVLQEELLISSEVDYYNECVKKIKCFTKEATRLEKISPKNLNDVYENLNIPNRDMSIEEIYDYLSHDEKYAFTDMKEIRKPILSIGYNEMSIEKQEEPKEELKKEAEVRPESRFVPNINSLFVPKMNTKMYTDYTFAEETRPLFVTEGPCSIKEIDFKDSEGKVYSAFSELDSLEYQNKGYKAFAISKNPYEYYRLEDVY
ncbi:hypothetical protein EGP91_00970 [bacterium]|nr:hypothetical protein [bacterium]